ncbi:amino acid ABC transporter permease [Bordetella bronchiseptica]|uniref:amino acid ABC transporter permease n=1 Tax=Bordetella bronchiseptica TaxID=518 RepID=UPI0004615778|nr:amino acid ABC transporter permease [Bordetella bronchiseptica]AWP79490.1 amino acid ABC transporter permease [Bordetella bronchiseptica]KAB1442660.1 amino acid ABC transporter permease [Bordetella bronchiseptica]KAB1568388.1 amino acid ABC transporter permease [Bordetella bronchiseptica]KDC57792.1 ABC transporter, permease protein [Bordetella bronchiseptica MBORD595]KDC75830.1 ABC transporter, permease protein [Bordetella bronchiseptica MBORD635]
MLDILHDYWPMLLVGQYPNGPLGGLALTLILALLGLLLSMPLALLIAIARVSPFRGLRVASRLLVNTVRGMPLLMLIFWAYFAVPKLTGGSISGFWTLVTALVIYESAYLSEVIRSGIEAIPKGQIEASRSLGVGYWTTMRKVVLPQALFNVLPSMTSQFVSTIKETSLGYVISVNELTFAANQVNNLVLTQPLQVFGILAIIYFLVCFSLSRSVAWLDRWVRRSRSMA